MPEGDTVWLAAYNLNAALASRNVVKSDIRVPAFATADLSGQPIHEVVSRGKHLLMRIGETTVHSHLKMEGSWHLYRPGSAWRRPAFEARAVITTDEWVAVGFALGITELVPTAEEDCVVGHLGPDLLGPDWDADVAAQRLLREPLEPAHTAVLEQRNLAGIGNEYANELLFVRGIHPRTPIGEVRDLPAMLATAERMLQANKTRSIRSTTGDLRPGRTAWVYGRERRPCLRCGTRIQHGQLGRPQQERGIYWCPRCQPALT